MFHQYNYLNIYSLKIVLRLGLGLFDQIGAIFLSWFRTKNWKPGDFDYCISEQGNAFFTQKYNISVHRLSNHRGNAISSVRRIQKKGAEIQVSALSDIKHYNEHMGVFYKVDMLHYFGDDNRKSKKWWHKLFLQRKKCVS